MRNTYHHTIKEKITCIQDEINSLPLSAIINSGGCIHFAYYLKKALDNIHVNSVPIFMDFDPISYSLKEYNSVSHVVLFVRGIGYIDGTDTVKKKSNLRYKYKKPMKIDLDKLRLEGNWNKEYKLKNNKKIEKIINKYLGGN